MKSFLLITLFLVGSQLRAEVLSYSGRLVNSSGVPVTGTVNLKFDLVYSGSTSTIRCTKTAPVPLSNGVFHANLDFTATECGGTKTLLEIIDEIPSGQSLTYQVTDLTNSKPYGFQPLSSVPLSIMAKMAKTLANHGATDGQVLKWDAATKKWLPSNPATGTGTLVDLQAGPGITVAPVDGDTYSVSITNGGVGTTQLADSSVNSAKIIDGSILGSDIANTTIPYIKLNIADNEIPSSKVNGLDSSLSGKEPTIPDGTTAQYYRGDKSWQDLNTAVRAAVTGSAPLTYNSSTGAFGLGIVPVINGGTGRNTTNLNSVVVTDTSGAYQFHSCLDGQVIVFTGGAPACMFPSTADSTKLPLAGGTMSGNINMANSRIEGLPTPVDGQEPATKSYVDSITGAINSNDKLPLAGGTMTGPIAMGTNKITDLSDPTSAQEAATKNYVDTTRLWSSGSGNVFRTSGNVGVGTSTPNGKLDVKGSIVMSGATSGFVGFQSPTAPTANTIWTLPGTDGTSGQVLRTDGSGVLSWFTPAGAGISALTGDVTASGSGSVAATISNSAVTSAKIADGTIIDADIAPGTITYSKLNLVNNDIPAEKVNGIDSAARAALSGTSPINYNSTSGVIALDTVPVSKGGTGLTSATANSLVTTSSGSAYQFLNCTSGQIVSFGGAGPICAALDDTSKLPLSGGVMTGQIDMNSYKIIGLATPTAGQDAATKSYVDSVTGTINSNDKLPLAGGTMTGAIAMGTNKITGLGYPTAPEDAATKNYVDATLAGTGVWSLNGGDVYRSSGNVGIGTSSPGYPLEVSGNAFFGSGGNGAIFLGSSNSALSKSGNAYTVGGSLTNNYLVLRTDGGEKVRIDPLGKVGIGTTVPNGRLDVKGSIVMSGATSGFTGFIAPATNTGNTVWTLPSADGASGDVLKTNGAGVLTWSSAGGGGDFFKDGSVAMTGDLKLNRFINGGNPGNVIDTGTAATNQFSIRTSDADLQLRTINSNNILLTTNGNERMRINSLGNIGVGTTTPNAKLDVKGPIVMSGAASGFVGFQSPAAPSANTIWTLPSVDGTSGQVLSTNGSGVLAWTTPSAGGITALTGDVAASGSGSVTATIANNAITTAKVADGAITYPKLNITDGEIPQAKVNGLISALTGKEPTIAEGTASQYWRGDKTWQTLNTTAVAEGTNLYFTEPRVRNTFLSGYTTGTAIPIAPTDTFMEAIGKLEAYVASLGSNGQWTANGGDVYRSSGNVGIGTSTPGTKLHVVNSEEALRVSSNDGVGAYLHIANSNNKRSYLGQAIPGAATYGTANNGLWLGAADGVSGADATDLIKVSTTDADRIAFITGSQKRMIIGANGNIGIGTTAPSVPFEVQTTATGMGIRVNRSGGASVDIQGGGTAGWIGTTTNHGLNFFTNNSAAQMTIATSGNIGVGTSTPNALLDVKGSIVMSGATSGYAGFRVPAVAGSTIWQLPSADGTSGQVLSTNGAGVLAWTTASAGGITALTGDVSASGSGSVAATIANNAVTSAKILDSTIVDADIANSTITYGKLNLANGIIPMAKLTSVGNNGVVTTNSSGDYQNTTCASGQILKFNFVSGWVCAADDATDATKLPLAGGTMTGAIAMGSNKITGLLDPTAAQDAATKAYVDSIIGGAGPWTVSGSDVYRSSGNVGIGTTTPGATLEVRSPTTATLLVTNTNPTTNPGSQIKLANYRGTQGDGNPSIVSYIARGTSTAPTPVASGMTVLSLQGRGYAEAGFGADRDGAAIDFVAATNWANSNVQTDMIFKTAGTGAWSSSERMRITANGRIGIANSNPTFPLDIRTGVGSYSAFIGSSPTSAGLGLGGNASGGILHSFTSGGGDADLFIQANGARKTIIGAGSPPVSKLDVAGNMSVGSYAATTAAPANGLIVSGSVGVGTATPTSPLEVKSTASSTNVLRVSNAANNKIWTLWETGGGNGEFHLWKNDGTRAVQIASSNDTFFNGGNVGIGTTSPNALLDVKGSIVMSGATSGFSGFRVPAVAGSTVWQLPSADGTSGQVLSTNGAGVLAWTNASAGGITALTGDVTASGSGSVTATIANNSVTYAKMNLTDGDIPQAKVNGLVTALNGKESTIAAGTPSQYWRGDKSWQTLNTTAVTEGANLYFTEPRVRSTALTGYSVGTALPINSTDTFMQAIGKLEAYVNSLSSNGQWTASGGNAFRTSGKIGIGTNSPAGKLSISGIGGAATDAGVEFFTSGNASGYTGWTGRIFTDTPTGSWGTAPFVFSVPDTSGTEIKTMTLLNGKVGIGTTNPTGKLHIYGGGDGTQYFKVANGSSYPNNSGDVFEYTGYYGASTPWSSYVGNDNVFRIAQRGQTDALSLSYVGSMTQLSAGQFNPTGPSYAYRPAYILDNTNGAESGIFLPVANSVGFTTSRTERMRIAPNGNVGVGTTNPGAKLHVNGATAFEDNSATSAGPTFSFWKSRNYAATQNGDELGFISFFGHSGSGLYRSAYILGKGAGTPTATSVPGQLGFFTTPAGSSDSTERMTISSSGNVGIGTTTPGALTEIWSSTANTINTNLRLTNTGISSTTDSGTAIEFFGNGSGGVVDSKIQSQMNNSGNRRLTFLVTQTAGALTERMTILQNGNVGIGTSTPSEKLEVSGNVKATAFISTSDKRLKKNIQIVKGLPAILQLRGVTYDWREDGSMDMGVIAQDVERVFPWAVVTDKVTGYKAVKYNSLIGPVIEAVKELDKKDKEISRKIASIEEENAELKKKNQQLERMLMDLAKRLDKLEASGKK